jgi:hypothetical protein
MILTGNDFPEYKKRTSMLTSWSEDPATKTFSGTGNYSIDFELPKEYFSPDLKILLDLGKVGNVAEIEINGTNQGFVWMRGQKPEISSSLKQGKNHLEIRVTNTLINRIAAMTKPAPLSPDMVPNYGSKDKQTSMPREFGFTPLPASGLMGPVVVVPVKKVVIPL